MLRQKWIVWTLESQLYEPKVLCIVPSLSKCWRDCGSFWNGVRTGMQSGLGVVGLQFLLWLLFWMLQILEQNPLPLTQLASLNPLEKIPQLVVGLNQTEKKNLGNSVCTLAGPTASVWLISHQPQLGPFPWQRMKKEGQKKFRKEESGTGRRKRKSSKASLAPHSSSARTLFI